MTAALFDELKPPLEAHEAVVEATRCLECGGAHAPAPCTVACPADVDVPGFVTAIAEGDPAHAAELIFAENLLGGTCARVCPTELLCEGACVLAHEGRRPIEIGRLQRHAADVGLVEPATLRRRVPATGFRVAVVGAGPAGLACAGELAARGHSVTVFDERQEVGGLVRYAIAPYRELRDPLPGEAALIRALGARLVLGWHIGPARLQTLAARFDAVVLAVGMGPDSRVHYMGDDLDGVWDSLPFIEAIKTGEPPRVGRRVAVIGGGNTAIDVAIESVRLGAETVTLLYRRTEAEMPAYPHEVEQARSEGVEIRLLTSPVRFLGRTWLEGVECVRMELGEPDESGRARPEPVPGSEHVVPCETAIKAIGQEPREEPAEWLGDRLLDAKGRLWADPLNGRTSEPWVYAAGDATNGGATVVEAVREGKLVARTVDDDLQRVP
jgi:glutamate synthase (NADPH/NADH) small chain